jgi:sulfhydrogenase subunit beta (sulfur reductase)
MGQLYQLSKKALLDGLSTSLQHYKLVALTRKQERTLYDYVKRVEDIVWSCTPTVLPFKKFLFPQDEVLVEYSTNGDKVTPTIQSPPQILFGMHPCDIHGMQILDEAFADSHGDPNYMSRRFKVNAHHATTGFDWMLYPENEDSFLLEVSTEKGKLILNQYLGSLKPAQQSALDHFKAQKMKAFEGEKPFKNLKQLPEIYEKNKAHPVWKEEGDRCLSCGSCIMVCPTCYCFDVADELAISLKNGQRLRRWDACMVSSFAVVAGGENFRGTAEARLKHRIHRKFNYLMKKHGQAVCVGCGRCVRACLADISPKTITEKITGEI